MPQIPVYGGDPRAVTTSPDEFTLVRSFAVGRFTVTISLGRAHGEAALIECVPDPGTHVTADELAAFFRARAQFMVEFSALAAARGDLVRFVETGAGVDPAVRTVQ